jgi:hypothetical protein
VSTRAASALLVGSTIRAITKSRKTVSSKISVPVRQSAMSSTDWVQAVHTFRTYAAAAAATYPLSAPTRALSPKNPQVSQLQIPESADNVLTQVVCRATTVMITCYGPRHLLRNRPVVLLRHSLPTAAPAARRFQQTGERRPAWCTDVLEPPRPLD